MPSNTPLATTAEGSPTAATASGGVPICVDLDGTLLKSDLLVESALVLIRVRLLYLFLLPLWLLKGRAFLKQEIARRVHLNASVLPYRKPLLDWLKEEKAAGRKLVLASASDELLVTQVATELAIFDEVLSSNGTVNLKGSRKRDVLVQKYGEKGFAYCGDASVDLPVWAAAKEAVLVGVSSGVAAKANKVGNVTKTFPSERGGLKTFLKAIRVHQWAKNALVFVPVFTAHKLGNVGLLVQASLGFLAFSLCASAVYLANDLMDLDADRRHRSKHKRPFAAGTLPLLLGIAAAPLFVIVSALIAVKFLPLPFAGVLALYFIVTNAYTFVLKREALLDVLCLAALYTLRIFAGGQSTSLPVSVWLIALSMFSFLSLALVKRVSELRLVKESNERVIHGRGYGVGDLPLLSQAGVSAGYMAVLVFALYIHSDEVKPLYSNPNTLWFICPLILYWITRVWLLTYRGKMHDDPVVFALRDRVSYVVGLIAVTVVYLAR